MLFHDSNAGINIGGELVADDESDSFNANLDGF
jgi:hypothetical protein